MEHERIPIERPQEGSLRESLRACDDVHVEERMSLEVANPSVQSIVEVFEVVPKASERLEIDTRYVQMTIEYCMSLAARLRIKDAIDIGRVD